MTYVIGEECIGTKDGACAKACPVDCIKFGIDPKTGEKTPMLYINPAPITRAVLQFDPAAGTASELEATINECINCDACLPACPVDAIRAEDDMPDKEKGYKDKNYTQKNADFFNGAGEFARFLPVDNTVGLVDDGKHK